MELIYGSEKEKSKAYKSVLTLHRKLAGLAPLGGSGLLAFLRYDASAVLRYREIQQPCRPGPLLDIIWYGTVM